MPDPASALVTEITESFTKQKQLADRALAQPSEMVSERLGLPL